MTCRVTDDVRTIGNVAIDQGSWRDDAVLADCYSRHDDRSGTDNCTIAHCGVKIKSTRKVMGQDDRMFVDITACSDMDALWVGPIN